MTYIRLDHTELIAAAQVINSCAVEAAQIGVQLSSCAPCAMPSEVRGLVDQAVAAVDRNLDEIASLLGHFANDLTQRAVSVALQEFIAMVQAVLPAAAVPVAATSVVAVQSSGSDTSGLLAVALGKVRRNQPLTELDKQILGDQIASDIAMGRKSEANEAMEKYNANSSTQSMMTSMQLGAMTSAPDPISVLLEPTESQIFDKVEGELGRPVGFLTDADKKHYAPNTYS